MDPNYQLQQLTNQLPRTGDDYDNRFHELESRAGENRFEKNPLEEEEDIKGYKL